MEKKTTTRIKKTGIDKAVMAPKSILIFGMNENGEVSENYEKMINEHGELFRLKRLAMRSEPGNMYYRNNRNGDIKYFVFIYGNIEQTFNAVNHIVDKIKEEKLSDYHIYMEKIESDTYDIAKAMLEKTGLSMDYFVRGEEKKKTEPAMKFPIDFKPKQMLDYVNKRVIGQEEQVRQLVFYVMRVVEAAAYYREDPAINCFLAAPSGTGKTEMAKAVRDFLQMHEIPVPVSIIDLSQITETGFKGKNSNTILDDICKNSTSSCDGRAICFLDEADKKFLPSYTTGGVDVNKAIQGNLLMMIEGNRYYIEDNEGVFDTSKTMFVFMGAFQDARNKKLERLKNLDVEEKNDKADEIFFGDISVSDMIETGMRDELAGRVGRVINLHRLSECDMRKVIQAKSRQIASEIGIKIELSEKAMEETLEIAYGRAGIREVINRIGEIAMNSIMDSYFAGKSYRNKKLVIDTLGTC
ncbi:MAG: AAA family ATPase [Lachnospiraceae bacterium]|nr:AAA family ATPase [Lachnospiraceae bacterium]